jgi:anthranilate synthase component II
LPWQLKTNKKEEQRMKVVMIDNYDSFTYNLVHIINEVLKDSEVIVMRNDEVDYTTLDEATHIILSPGPGIPDEAGDLKKVIKDYAATKKLFGVCLGHQAIGEVFGAELHNLEHVFHGKRTLMHKTNTASPLFNKIDDTFYAGRYHSWAINKSSNIDAFDITAVDEYNEIMALQHKELEVYGVQFHPESVMTDNGKVMIENFLAL